MEMLRNRAIPVVMKALGRICSLDLEVADKADVTKCIGAGFGMLTRSLRGRPWVCQALDSGFFSVFLSSGRWIARLGFDSWSTICSKSFTILYQNLVFRSVLRSVAQAVSEKKIDALDKFAEVTSNGCLSKPKYTGSSSIKRNLTATKRIQKNQVLRVAGIWM
jgi:hypothetical protein